MTNPLPTTRIQRRRQALPLADNRRTIDRLYALTTPPRHFRGPILPRTLLTLMRSIREENRTH